MTPSRNITQDAAKTFTATDRGGHRLLLRRLTALDTLRLFKAAGPGLAQNEAWLSMAGLVFSVLEIDGVPVPPPATEAQIESLVDRLGDEGLATVAHTIREDSENSGGGDHLGNLPGTPS